MTTTAGIRAALAVALVAAACTSSRAQDLAVYIEPTLEVPKAVTLEVNGVPQDLEPKPPNGFVYTWKIKLPATAWEGKYLLAVRWPGADQTITIRVTRVSESPLKIWVYNHQHSPDKRTLDSIDNDRPGLNNYLTRYFAARDVYYGFTILVHPVKVRALKLWFDAAYNLSKQYGYIGIDEEVIKQAADMEDRAKKDKQLKALLVEFAGGAGYFSEMSRQYRAIYLREIALVESLTRSGHIRGAALINDHYLTTLKALPEDERKQILDIQRLSLDVLSTNSSYLAKVNNTKTTAGVELFPGRMM